MCPSTGERPTIVGSKRIKGQAGRVVLLRNNIQPKEPALVLKLSKENTSKCRKLTVAELDKQGTNQSQKVIVVVSGAKIQKGAVPNGCTNNQDLSNFRFIEVVIRVHGSSLAFADSYVREA